MGLNDINSLAHSKWNCKYHVVFAPKYRRKVFYGEKRIAILRYYTHADEDAIKAAAEVYRKGLE